MKISLILLFVSIIWIGSEVMLILFRRSGKHSENRDSGSIVWLNTVIYGSVALAVFITYTGFGFIPGAGLTLAWIGLILILLGLAIRWTSIFTLREYFTVNVAIQPGHRIVRKGLYRTIRHPSYLGALISFAGLGFALGNWIALASLIVPVTFAFSKRIKIEERALIQTLGDEYRHYCSTTWRLIPWLY